MPDLIYHSRRIADLSHNLIYYRLCGKVLPGACFSSSSTPIIATIVIIYYYYYCNSILIIVLFPLVLA